MRTHHAIRPAAPGFTGGGDEVRAACEGKWGVFDRLIDREHGPANQRDLLEAWALCNGCPIKAACHLANRDEPWVAAMYGRPGRIRPITGQRVPEDIRVRIAETNRQRAEAKHNARLIRLQQLIGAGADLAGVLAELGVKRNSLWSWCQNHGHEDLYRRIAPGRGAPGRKRGAA